MRGALYNINASLCKINTVTGGDAAFGTQSAFNFEVASIKR